MKLSINTLIDLADKLKLLITEGRNPASFDLDKMSSLDIVKLMNSQDALVADAVAKEAVVIGEVVEVSANALLKGGRIIYVGAGTSGRLGVLDASECPPTFGVSRERVVAIMAGGPDAMFVSQEGCEDDPVQGADDLSELNLTKNDVVIGLAVSGRTPYVIGALKKANELNVITVALTCNPNSSLADLADYSIAPLVGPEILTGSTRLKSGTAQKMVLNMISTGAMIRIGKCYSNLMVDLKVSNKKLKARALKLVQEATSTDADGAFAALEATNWNVKTSIFMILAKTSEDRADEILNKHNGRLSDALLQFE